MRSDLKIRTSVNSTVSALPPLDALENVLESASPCCASNGSSCFKENININRSETQNLSLEPLQMKRKKKGGGYNIRKSLAWNRAFFTEEGVLDPLELSAISGGSCRKGLPFIDEDATGGSLLPIKLENDLVKELQEEDLCKDRKDFSSSKLDSSSFNFTTSTSLTSNNVPTRGGTNPGSRFSDCPRPFPSSSLKRPAMVNVGKAAGKDLKLPKVPGLKSGASPICATRSTVLRANCVKHNQITKPDFNIRRNAGSKNSSKNTHNESKASSLRSTHYSDGKSDNSSFRRHSSINMSPILVEKAYNSGSEMISSSLTPAKPVNSSEGQRESANFATPFTRNAHVSCSTIPSQNQMMKPSGLRMPSPSLSFFSQPKPSALCDLSLRDTEKDVCGSRKPENLRLQGSFRRTPKTDNRIPESITSVSRATSSRSECMASLHVSAPDVLRLDLEQNSAQEGAVNVLYGNPVTPESRLELNYAIHESETVSAIDDAPKEKNMCNSMVLKHGAISGTQCEDALDHKLQNSLTTQKDQEENCKPDCYETRREQTDPFKYSLDKTDMRTDKDNNVLKTNEIASEQLGVSKLNGSSCTRSASSEASEHREPMTESTYSGSKHLHADLLEEAAFIELYNLREGETHMQNAIFASTTGGFKNKISLVSEVGKIWVVQNKVEMEPQGSIELNTTEGLLPEKQICIQNSQQEENVQKLLSVFPDRKDGKKMIDTQLTSSRSLHKMHDCEFDKEKMISQPLLFTEFDYVGNPVSCESPNNLMNTTSNHDGEHNGITNGSLSCPANENMPGSLHQDTLRAEIDYCSSFPESTTHEVSQKNTSRKMTEVGPIIPDGNASDWSTSTMSVKESESDMDNLRNIEDSATVLKQSPESNMLTECCSNQSEPLASPTAEFVAENLVHSDERLHVENYLQTESPADVSHEYNALEIMEDSVRGQKEICLSISQSSSVSANESPIEHGSCNDGYGTGGLMGDTITEPSRTNPSSDISESEVSEDANSSFSCLHPELDNVKGEAVSAPNNKVEVGLNEKSCSLAPPQNAIPFSDEWLAAIEAAGEDILTRKGGAVQNSPPDKSLPEPSPWSPVRKKNNQIGPFDCTKYTNIDPSDSN